MNTKAVEFDHSIPIADALRYAIKEWQRGKKHARNLKRLADQSGLSYQTILSIARGQPGNREMATVLKIARHILEEERLKSFIAAYYPELPLGTIVGQYSASKTGIVTPTQPAAPTTNKIPVDFFQQVRERAYFRAYPSSKISDVIEKKVIDQSKRIGGGIFGGSTGLSEPDKNENISSYQFGHHPPEPRDVFVESGVPTESLIERENMLLPLPPAATDPQRVSGYITLGNIIIKPAPQHIRSTASWRDEYKGNESVSATAEGHLIQESTILARVGPELLSYLRREHGERGIQIFYDCWTHRIKNRNEFTRKVEPSGILLSWSFRRKYRSILSAPLAPTGNIAITFMHGKSSTNCERACEDKDKRKKSTTIDSVARYNVLSQQQPDTDDGKIDQSPSDWKTLAGIAFVVILAAYCAKDEPEHTMSGSFEVLTYRVEDEHFAAYEKRFPDFPTPFIYEQKKWNPIKKNSAKGIICLESEPEKTDLILHKRAAWQYLDDEDEITVHNLKTCFE